MSKETKPTASHARKRTQNKKNTRTLAICGTVFLSIVGIVLMSVSGLLWYFQYNRNSSLDALTDEQLGLNTALDDDIINIALFGIDSPYKTSFKGRSDSLMILSVDTAHGAIKITSILRDSVVPVEGYNVQKINAAYSYGGPELAIKTLNEAFDLNIRDYATVNFIGMGNIIDVVGGIEVDISEAERNEANKHIKYTCLKSGTKPVYIEKAGKQILNGNQAVTFARIRKISTINGQNNDFGRTDRQRYVMEQLFNKALSMSKAQYPALIKSMLPYMETSMSYSDILKLAGVLTKEMRFEQARIPKDYSMTIPYAQKDVPTSLGSVVYYRLDYATDMMHAFIYDDVSQEDYMATHPADNTPWYTEWKANQ